MSSKRRDKSIYVETTIHTDLDTLWNYTQIPSKHVQWDMRFTEILYLPRLTEEEMQKFHYQTRIGFGLAIAGTGATRASWIEKEKIQSRLSTLSFSSEQKLSLISKGRGYWQYTEQGDDVIFLTRYDYQTRFGAVGQAFDRFLFRPLFGWATAWSFDVLKIWLEQHIPPAATIQRTIIHYVSLALLAVLWLYQGIVPKLLYPETGELAQIHASGLFSGWEQQALVLLGLSEAALAIIFVIFHRFPILYSLQLVLLLLLPAVALANSPELLQASYNPATITIPMIGLCFVAWRTCKGLPNASRCLRKPKGKAK
ncbi:DoxX-like family protein [Paenibacillus algorifonticola]|uniref:DoxX-like family protein n=1 Tax=Paenibacillus algorifonticola TaxID=684063 RepID=UPI003D2B60C0